MLSAVSILFKLNLNSPTAVSEPSSKTTLEMFARSEPDSSSVEFTLS